MNKTKKSSSSTVKLNKISKQEQIYDPLQKGKVSYPKSVQDCKEEKKIQSKFRSQKIKSNCCHHESHDEENLNKRTKKSQSQHEDRSNKVSFQVKWKFPTISQKNSLEKKKDQIIHDSSAKLLRKKKKKIVFGETVAQRDIKQNNRSEKLKPIINSQSAKYLIKNVKTKYENKLGSISNSNSIYRNESQDHGEQKKEIINDNFNPNTSRNSNKSNNSNTVSLFNTKNDQEQEKKPFAQSKIEDLKKILQKESLTESNFSKEQTQVMNSSKIIRNRLKTFNRDSAKKQKSVNTSFNTTKSLFGKQNNCQYSLQGKKIEKIGQGSSGVFYKFRRIGQGTVLLKKIKYFLKSKQLDIMTLVTGHPFVVNLHGTQFTSQHKGYSLGLVLEYFKDGDLGKLIKQEGTIDFERVKIFTYQILRGLHYLHSHEIIHRDIDTSNIMRRGNVLAIGDFGCAKIFHDLQENSLSMCSKSNRAPEVIFGDRLYNKKIDMWAVGCIMAEMILGQSLFDSSYPHDLIYEIIRIRGSPPQQFLQKIKKEERKTQQQIPTQIVPKRWEEVFQETLLDPKLKDLLEKLLEFDPQKRISAFSALTHPYFEEIRNQKSFQSLKQKYQLGNNFFSFSEIEIEGSDGRENSLIPAWVKQDEI